MKSLYTVLITMLALVLFASLADAKPPFWDDQINSPGRFKVLSEFGGATVFDKGTGLVWEKVAGDTDGDGDVEDNDKKIWLDAQSHCNKKTVGNRKGWRLPTLQELASLVDPNESNPALPDGHPFSNVKNNRYSSATTLASDTSGAWDVSLVNGGVNKGDKSDLFFVWCVRGGQGVDPQ